MKPYKFSFACPYCFDKHELNSMLFKCSHHECDNIISVGKHEFLNLKYPKRCLYCKKGTIEIHCPNKNYGYTSGTEGIIPEDILKAGSLSVAMIGDDGAGKTCYAGALLAALKYTFRRFFDDELTNADERSSRYFKECYYNPLFENHRLPSVNTGIGGDKIPVTFYLPITDDINKKLLGTFVFSFSPTNSELISKTPEELSRMIPVTQIFSVDYICNSDAVILVIDPLTIPPIGNSVRMCAEKLGDGELLKICSPERPYSADRILRAVIDIMRMEERFDEKRPKRIKKPLAIVFTKLDLLEKYYIPMSGSNRLHRESRHLEMRSYNRREHKITAEEVTSLIVKNMGDETVELIRQFENYSFFAVSALGEIPDADGKLPRPVTPKRVLDPVLWLLSDRGLIARS